MVELAVSTWRWQTGSSTTPSGGASGFRESAATGSGMEDGGSLVGKESASVLSSIFSRSSALVSVRRSSGSLRLPESSGQAAGYFISGSEGAIVHCNRRNPQDKGCVR